MACTNTIAQIVYARILYLVHPILHNWHKYRAGESEIHDTLAMQMPDLMQMSIYIEGFNLSVTTWKEILYTSTTAEIPEPVLVG